MTPIRPVSEDHRREPADYELEPNELAACPNPWCESHKRPERGYVPFISKSRASSELRVACPVCPMSGPWADTEAEARKAWNNALTQAPRSCCADEREQAARIAEDFGNRDWFEKGKVVRQCAREIATAIRSNSHD